MQRAVLVVLVLIAAAVGWWLWSRDEAMAPPAPGELPAAAAPATPERVTAASATIGSAPPAVVGSERAAADLEPKAPVAAPDEAVLHGRCVDEQGVPLAGVTVELRGWEANDQRLDAHRRDHGEVVWKNPAKSATGADGRFAARFVPPPPYQFVLDLELAGRVPFGGRWGEIAAGTNKDLGDVVLARGALVSGRVVDVDGVPREGIEVGLDRYNRPDRWRTEMLPQESYSTRTRADGTFQFEQPLMPAIWNLDLRHGQLTEPRAEVAIEAPATTLQFVVKRDADVQRINGVVVDEAGQPVAGVQVQPVGRTGGGWMTTSKQDGTFLLERRESGDPDGPFALVAEHDQCEPLRTEPEHTWGARNVRLVMRRGIDVTVHVTRASDATPVEQFAVRIVPDAKTTSTWSSADTEVRGGWQHDGGRHVVRGIRRGRHFVVVEPRADSGLVGCTPIPIEVGNGPAPELRVELVPTAAQLVRVRDAAGKAIAGSKVELVEMLAGEQLDLRMRVSTIGDWSWLRASPATLVCEATTDATGTCSVRGAVQRPYAVRVTGAAHAPVVRNGVMFDDGGLEIVVPTGATLHVTLGPDGLLADLHTQAGLPRQGALDDYQRDMQPGVLLWRKVGDGHEQHPVTAPGFVPFDAAGKATIGGIAAGTWDLQLRTAIADESGYSHGAETVRTGLVFADGAVQELALDLPELRLAKLRGTLRKNGEPAAHGMQWIGDCGVMPNGMPRQQYRNARSNADGSFEALLPAGTWRVEPYLQIGTRYFSAATDVRVHIVAGQDARADIDVRTVTAKVRVLAPDGRPLAGSQLEFVRDGLPLGAAAEPTDAEGRTTITTTPGQVTLKLWIRSLQDPPSQQAFWRANHANPDAIAAARVETAPILFGSSSEAEVEIRLPTAWDR